MKTLKRKKRDRRLVNLRQEGLDAIEQIKKSIYAEYDKEDLLALTATRAANRCLVLVADLIERKKLRIDHFVDGCL
jgi:hypothetical protein